MILIGICLLSAAALALWFGFGEREKESLTLRISWDGAEVDRQPLTPKQKERADYVSGQGGTRYCLLLYTEGGIFCRWYEGDSMPEIPVGKSYNLLSVSGGEVRMEAADCRDQICVHHRPISASGESIICLPHRLVVEIVGETDEETLDGMVK